MAVLVEGDRKYNPQQQVHQLRKNLETDLSEVALVVGEWVVSDSLQSQI
jgi:hypothetical protein